MQTSEQLRKERKEARHTMAANIGELLTKNSRIRATFRDAQTSAYGEEVTARNICQYVMDNKNGVANEENVLEAIGSLRKEARRTMGVNIEELLTKKNSRIRATFIAAQRSTYGEEVTLGNICQYVMDNKNGVANEENVLEAIDSLRAEARKKGWGGDATLLNLRDSQSKEPPSQFHPTIIKPDIGANSAAVNARNVKCGCCSIF